MMTDDSKKIFSPLTYERTALLFIYLFGAEKYWSTKEDIY